MTKPCLTTEWLSQFFWDRIFCHLNSWDLKIQVDSLTGTPKMKTKIAWRSLLKTEWLLVHGWEIRRGAGGASVPEQSGHPGRFGGEHNQSDRRNFV